MLENFYPLFALMFICSVIILLLKALTRTSAKSTYQLRERLLTPTELKFFKVLQQAIGMQYFIAPKVRLADVVSVHKNLEKKDWASAWNKINKKHVDFALCDPDTSSFVAVIELDDRSHTTNEKTIKSDQFKNECLLHLGLPLIRIERKPRYDIDDIRTKINQKLEVHEHLPEPKSPRPISPVVDPCPKCGSPLITRTAKSGANSGKSFKGCSRYPDCSYTGSLTGI